MTATNDTLSTCPHHSSERRRLRSGPPLPRPDRGTVLLGAVLAGGVALRLVAIRHGLPFVYNPDEEQHFVPHAAAAAEGDWNPRYFDNPSALTYLLAIVLGLAFLGDDPTRLLDTDPTAVFTVARVVVAALGVLLVLLAYDAGRRYFDRTVGLLAAALLAFGFLPVYYSHQALNDVPTLLPVTVALVGCLLVHERGSWWAYLLAGAAVGVAAGTKYLAAPMALVVALAALLRVLERRERATRAVLLLALSGAVCVGALLALNPFLVLEFDLARGQFTGQSSHAATEKLGQDGVAWLYYPQSLLWGFGLLPLLFALVGTALALRAHRSRCLLLIAFPVVLYLYMGTQERFFGRWLLPAYPALAILAGYGTVRVARWVRERPRIARTAAAGLVLPLLTAVVLAQPVADSVRSVAVLSRTDSRTQAHAWIRRHIEEGSRIVVEPSVPSGYLEGEPGYEQYRVERPYQLYETRLRPELLDSYRRGGYCWVLVSSHQRDRGLAAGLRGARAYYARLDRESRLAADFSPYRRGARPPAFSYDLSFNWYPIAFERPGPHLELRRLVSCPDAGR